jgi:hypothetical protein
MFLCLINVDILVSMSAANSELDRHPMHRSVVCMERLLSDGWTLAAHDRALLAEQRVVARPVLNPYRAYKAHNQ